MRLRLLLLLRDRGSLVTFSATFAGHVGHDSANVTPTRPWTHHWNPFVTEWSRDPPSSPDVRQAQMVSLKVWPSCTAGIVDLSRIPRRASVKCCTAANQTRAYNFLHFCASIFFFFFTFPFSFSHPSNSPSWQHCALPTDGDVEDDDDCHGNARRVQRRMWEERDGDGTRAAVHSVEMFPKVMPAAVDVFNLVASRKFG